VFGNFGFSMVAVTALFAAASSINAGLYAVTKMTNQLAELSVVPWQMLATGTYHLLWRRLAA